MKTVHLIRHAKSCWNNTSLLDRDRPLAQRGIHACKVMASIIDDVGCDFENIYCSPAIRAQQTIEHIALHLSGKACSWVIDEQLYTFNSSDLVTWLQALDNTLQSVVIVGHNPALLELSNSLLPQTTVAFPTCAYQQLSLDVDLWRDVERGVAQQRHFLTPKMFK